MNTKTTLRHAGVVRDLQSVAREEARQRKAALKTKPARWKQELESRLPEKVYSGLESAFCKAFSTVFQKGSPFLERTFRKKGILASHRTSDHAVRRRGSRLGLRGMKNNADAANFGNLTLTTVEGIGLGALGVGIPDVVLFIAALLKGIYQTALHYGFEYEGRAEQILILKMMEASLSGGEEWKQLNTELDKMMIHGVEDVSDEAFEAQMKKTAAAFAMDMLLLKFVQSLPVVGVIGGAANPVYYRKVLRCVELKYRKRYLWKILKETRQKK